MAPWCVYIIETTSGNLYTGITTDLKRRWREHKGLKQGAKYLKANPPLMVKFVLEHADRSSASKHEASIKKLRKDQKLALINSNLNQLSNLAPNYFESDD